MRSPLAQVEAQIAKLQERAAKLREQEVEGVIARIRVAIDHYGLTADDLGFGKRGRLNGKGHSPGTSAKSAARGTKRIPKRPTVGRIKFRDEHGNEWTGHGRAPQWYKDALSQGRTSESLLVR